MDHAKFEKLKHEIAADATVEQLLDLEAQTARLLAERVSEALVARQSSSRSFRNIIVRTVAGKDRRATARLRRPPAVPLPENRRGTWLWSHLQRA